MAVRSIRTEGDEALRKRCKEVKTVDERVRALLDDMMDTLHATDGAAALAANQVGILKRLVVIDYCGYVLKLVNPVIVGRDGVQECLEGCLSFPGRIAKTIRPKSVTVQALDENGEELLLTGEGEMTGRYFWTRRWRCIVSHRDLISRRPSASWIHLPLIKRETHQMDLIT